MAMARSLLLALFLLLISFGGKALATIPVLQNALPAQVRPVSALAGNSGQHVHALNLRVETPDGPLELLLTPASRMQAQAATMVAGIRDGHTRLYRGSVAGQAGSWVRMAYIDGAWLGAIRVADKLWLMDPARQHPQLASRLGLGRQDSLVFTLDDIHGLGPMDLGGVAPPPGALPAPMAVTGATADAQAGTTRYLGVTLVLDTEFQNHYGATAKDIAVAMLNIVDGFYSSQVDTEVYLYALQSLASNGTLTDTDSGKLLDAFRTWLTGSPVPFSGLAHLLSGKDFEGSIVGRAWVGSLCSPTYGSGVDQLTFSTAGGAAILAHEMGHNYGADHDSDGNSCPASGYIMNASTNITHPPTQFSTCSLDYFADYLSTHSATCLAAPPNAIFNDGFD